jgi:hypothetical protein
MCDTVTSCESHKDQAKRTIGLLSTREPRTRQQAHHHTHCDDGHIILIGMHVYIRGEPNSHPEGQLAVRMVYAAKALLFALDCSDGKARIG